MQLKKAHKIIILGVVAIASAIGFYVWQDYSSPKSQMTRLCEPLLLDRLKSPAGYKAVSIDLTVEPMPKEDFLTYREQILGKEVNDTEREFLNSPGIKPTIFGLTIKYDAPNGFGALLRGDAYCEYVSETEKFSPYSNTFVYLDGQSQLSYLTNKLHVLNGTPPELVQTARSIKLVHQLHK